MLFYFPRLVVDDPLVLLRLWDHISSFGGILGGAAGLWLFFRLKAREIEPVGRLAYLDVAAFVFPRRLLVLAAVIATGACSGLPTERTGLVIATERSEYLLWSDYRFIEVAIANPTAKPATLVTCANVVTTFTEIEVDGTWKEHGTNVTCLNGGLEAYRIDPGQQITAHAFVHDYGRYRVRAALFMDGETMRFSRETSPAFRVRY